MTKGPSEEKAVNGVKRLSNGEFLVIHPLDDVAEERSTRPNNLATRR